MPAFREGAAQRVTDYHEESGWLYAQIVYNWTSGDGRDLDTRTRIVFPAVTGYVGWAQGNTQSLGGKTVIAWPSGDNTSYYGPEVALAYLGYIKEALPDTQNCEPTPIPGSSDHSSSDDRTHALQGAFFMPA